MSRDVNRLLEAAGVPGFPYRARAGRAAGTGAAGSRRRGRPELAVALVSPVAGAGRTTVAAAVARALARARWRTLAIDADPRGDLAERLALGGGGDALRCVALAIPGDVLDGLEAGPDALVIDTPAGLPRGMELALAAATEAVVVLRADAASCRAAPQVEAALARHQLRSPRPFHARYVVNQFDARRAADREALAALRQALGARLWPVPLQWDAALARVTEAPLPLEAAAPGSQLVADLEALAQALARAGAVARAADA